MIQFLGNNCPGSLPWDSESNASPGETSGGDYFLRSQDMEFLYRLGAFLAQTQSGGQTPIVVPGSNPKLPVMTANVPVVILEVIYCIICLALVIMVMTQTTKSEGLTGTLGGTTQSIFRGKKSFEEKMTNITNWIAGAFVIGSFVIFLIIKQLLK